MANIFEDVGRSGSLRDLNRNMTDLAFKMRGAAQDEKRTQIFEQQANIDMAIKQEQLSQMRKERARDNTMIPLDIAGQAFDSQSVRNYAMETAKGMGLVKDGGITVGDGRMFMQVFNDPKGPYAKRASELRLAEFEQGYKGAESALQQYMQSKPGVNPKNDKKAAELAMQAQGAKRKYIGAFQASEQMKTSIDLMNQGYTSDSIFKFLRGEGDLELRPDIVAKNTKTEGPNAGIAQLKLDAWKSFFSGKATPEQKRMIGADNDPFISQAAQMVNNDLQSVSLSAEEKADKTLALAETMRNAAAKGETPQPQGGIQEGQTATNPKTGEKLIFKGGQWVPLK